MDSKNALTSKTIWFHLVMLVAAYAAAHNIEWLAQFLDTEEERLLFAVALQSVGGVALRFITTAAVRVTPKPLLPMLVAVCLMGGGALGCATKIPVHLSNGTVVTVKEPGGVRTLYALALLKANWPQVVSFMADDVVVEARRDRVKAKQLQETYAVLDEAVSDSQAEAVRAFDGCLSRGARNCDREVAMGAGKGLVNNLGDTVRVLRERGMKLPPAIETVLAILGPMVEGVL